MQNDGPRSGDGAPAGGTGLAPNLSGALCYLLGLITGILFLVLDRSPFVRFHAYQSILFSVAWIVFWVGFNIVLSILVAIPFLGFLAALAGFLVGLVLGLGGFVLWVVLMVKAFQGAEWKLPYLGEMAERYAAQR